MVTDSEGYVGAAPPYEVIDKIQPISVENGDGIGEGLRRVGETYKVICLIYEWL